MKKKLISVILSVAMIGTLLTGCGGSGNSQSQELADSTSDAAGNNTAGTDEADVDTSNAADTEANSSQEADASAEGSYTMFMRNTYVGWIRELNWYDVAEEKTGIHLIEYLEGQKNLEVFYAPGPRGARISPEKRARMLALHPFLHLNEQEAMELSGQTQYEKAARHLQAATKNAVVVTLGNRGAFCLKKDGTGRLFPPAPVKAIVDTIGAGDTHAGAILACLTKGKPLEEAVAYANRMAAAVVKVRGASLPPGLIPHF